MRFLLLIILASVALGQSPEQRAISYLEAEVSSWSRDNRCYSCHNNGDGARALYAAAAAGYQVHETALTDTKRWLDSPAGWDENKGDPGFSDKVLARLQWTATLAAARDNDAGLAEAAQTLVRDQRADGSWPGDADGSVGSPVTWGRALTTAMAATTLRAAGAEQHRVQIAAAENWLRALDPKNVPAAAALALAFNEREAAETGRGFLRNTQSSDGGWGPYRNAPSEVFDTALAILSLEDSAQRQRGRDYLLRTQFSGGGWPETTRPSGSQSYAQHVSTTAWALMALLATDTERD